MRSDDGGSREIDATPWPAIIQAQTNGAGTLAWSEGIGRLYSVYRCRVMRIALKLFKTEEAEDMTHEFFTHLWTESKLSDVRYIRPRAFRVWMDSTARHYFLNQISKAKAKKHGAGKAALQVDALLECEQTPDALIERTTPEDLELRSYAHGMFDGALERLRQCCRLEGDVREFDLLRSFLRHRKPRKADYVRIGKLMDRTPQAITTALSRLFAKLKEQLHVHVQTMFPRATPEEIEMEKWFILTTCGLPKFNPRAG